MKHIVQFSGGKDSTAMLLISLLMELKKKLRKFIFEF